MTIQHWTISPELITQEALKLDYKINILSRDKNLYAIYKNNKPIFFKSSSIMKDSLVGARIADNKDLLFKVIDEYMPKFPKPKSINLKSNEVIEFKLQKKQLNYPLVAKPTDGTHGDDVIVNIKNKKQLKIVLNTLFKNHNNIVVQEMLSGDDHRILIIGHKVKAVTKRIPAFIIGNGQKNIKELVEIENKHPMRSDGDHTSPLSQIIINEETNRLLQSINMNINSIPNKDDRIYLKQTANISTGGIGIDCTDKVNLETITLAENLSELLEMNILGIDIITNDISQPLNNDSGLIEANSCPGLRMHHFPYKGKSRNVAKEILKLL